MKDVGIVVTIEITGPVVDMVVAMLCCFVNIKLLFDVVVSTVDVIIAFGVVIVLNDV